MTWKRDREMELATHVRTLGDAVEKFMRRLEGETSVVRGEKGGKERERQDGGGRDFAALDRAEERLAANLMDLVPGLGQFLGSLNKLRSAANDFATVLEQRSKRDYYPWKTPEEREQMSASLLQNMARQPAPWTREYLDNLKKMSSTTPGEVDFKAFNQSKKLADAMKRADRMEKLAAGGDIFGMLPEEGLSKAKALDARGAPFWLRPAEGMSRAAAAAKTGAVPQGIPFALAAGPLPTAELAPGFGQTGLLFSMADKLGAALAPMGAVAAAVVAVAALPPLIRNMAGEMAESNRRFAGLNAVTAASFAEYDVFTLRRNIEIGRRTAYGAEYANRQRMESEAAWTDLDVLWTDAKNAAGGLLSKAVGGVGQALSPLAQMVNQDETRDKWARIDWANREIGVRMLPIAGPMFNIFDSLDWIGQQTGLWKPVELMRNANAGTSDPLGDWMSKVARTGEIIKPAFPDPGVVQAAQPDNAANQGNWFRRGFKSFMTSSLRDLF